MRSSLSALAPFDTPVPKGFLQGTHRAVPPEVTVEHVRRLMPALGITRVANVTGLDHIGIPVVMVCRPNARALSVAQGKGLTLAAAQASGLMEAFETFHAERIMLPLKLAGYEELRVDHRVADISQLPRGADRHIHPSQPLHWIAGVDLFSGETVWAPFDLVHTNYTLPMRQTMSGFTATSNGLASGNTLLEAISHAICEVVERDATTLWRLRPAAERAQTRVDLDTIGDPDCRMLLERYACAEMAVLVYEISSDIGIPVFLCRIFDRHDQPLRRLGYTECMGCHPTREVALLRALTEAAQGRLTMIAGSRDDNYPGSYTRQRDPATIERLRAEYAHPGQHRSFAAAPSFSSDSFNADVSWLLDRLSAAGLRQVIVVDLSRPEFGLAVVRVIIPGLEALSEGSSYTPGPRARSRSGVRQ